MKKSDLSKAIDFHRRGEYKKAEKLYLKLIKDKKQRVETIANANANLGGLYFQFHEYDKAILFLKKAIYINPLHTNTLNNLALVYKNSEKFHDSIDILKQVLKLDPHHKEAIYNIGYSYSKIESYLEAISYFEKVITMDNQYVNAYFQLANIYEFHFFNYTKAVDIYHQILNLEPENVIVNFNLSQCYMALSNYSEALHYVDITLKLNSTYEKAQYRFCELSLLTSNFDNSYKGFDTRLTKKHKSLLSGKIWKGESLQNKTIVIAREQGYGDNIMIFRFNEVLKSMGANVIWSVDENLYKLFITDNSITVILEKIEIQ